MNTQLMDDLCRVAVYAKADCAVKAGTAILRLVKEGIMDSAYDLDSAYDRYEEEVIEYAESRLPDGWALTRDHWGAKCFALNPGWNAPKTGTYFSGDACGVLMLFENFKALEEYTGRVVEEIANNERECEL